LNREGAKSAKVASGLALMALSLQLTGNAGDPMFYIRWRRKTIWKLFSADI
jgi:hypothetical protein